MRYQETSEPQSAMQSLLRFARIRIKANFKYYIIIIIIISTSFSSSSIDNIFSVGHMQ